MVGLFQVKISTEINETESGHNSCKLVVSPLTLLELLQCQIKSNHAKAFGYTLV